MSSSVFHEHRRDVENETVTLTFLRGDGDRKRRVESLVTIAICDSWLIE